MDIVCYDMVWVGYHRDGMGDICATSRVHVGKTNQPVTATWRWSIWQNSSPWQWHYATQKKHCMIAASMYGSGNMNIIYYNTYIYIYICRYFYIVSRKYVYLHWRNKNHPAIHYPSKKQPRIKSPLNHPSGSNSTSTLQLVINGDLMMVNDD